MKPALVLGFALAANAMASDQPENELFVAPHGKFDRDPAQRFPGKIIYDELADDELYKGFPARENFSSYEEWLRATRKYDADDEFLVRPVVPHIAADDDEFLVRLPPKKPSQSEEEYQRLLAKWRPYRDDEELFIAPQGKLADLAKKYPGMIMFDEQADDELLSLAPPSRDQQLKEQQFRAAQEQIIQKFMDSPHIIICKAADDELRVVEGGLLHNDGIRRFYTPYIDQETGELRIAPGQYTKLAADDEDLFFTLGQRVGNLANARPTLMFDEAADDELVVKLKSREFFKSDEEYKNYLAHHRAHPSFDDAADDELAVKFVHLPIAETVAHDDELTVKASSKKPVPIGGRGAFKSDEEYQGYLAVIHGRPIHNHPSFDDAHDDELRLAPDHLSGRLPHPDMKSVLSEKQYQKYLKGQLHVTFDDDELAVRTVTLPSGEKVYVPWSDDENYVRHKTKQPIIDQADNELAVRPAAVRPATLPSGETVYLAWDDDELAFISRAPRVFVDRNLVKKNQTSEAGHKKMKPAKNTTLEALVRDDEADDELLYLGQLIQDRAFVPRTFDDDEFRVKGEKPAHVKIQEMGTEGPKIKRKFRPVANEIPLTEN